MLTQITFGTSGWRAVIAEEFTFANVRRAVQGVARYIAAQSFEERCVQNEDGIERCKVELFQGAGRDRGSGFAIRCPRKMECWRVCSAAKWSSGEAIP
jgi:Phosphoglucomutase/phosphomannomutase, alpha/beta/alpha domain I